MPGEPPFQSCVCRNPSKNCRPRLVVLQLLCPLLLCHSPQGVQVGTPVVCMFRKLLSKAVVFVVRPASMETRLQHVVGIRKVYIYSCLFPLSKCTTTLWCTRATTTPPFGCCVPGYAQSQLAQEPTSWVGGDTTPSLECRPLPGLALVLEQSMAPLLELGPLVWARRPLPVPLPLHSTGPSRKVSKAPAQARKTRARPSQCPLQSWRLQECSRTLFEPVGCLLRGRRERLSPSLWPGLPCLPALLRIPSGLLALREAEPVVSQCHNTVPGGTEGRPDF